MELCKYNMYVDENEVVNYFRQRSRDAKYGVLSRASRLSYRTLFMRKSRQTKVRNEFS